MSRDHDGMIELVFTPPEIGNCYEHVRATETYLTYGKDAKGKKNKKAGRTEEILLAPEENFTYVGELMEIDDTFISPAHSKTYIFDNDGVEIRIPHFHYHTFFRQVPCQGQRKIREMSVYAHSLGNIKENPAQARVLGHDPLRDIIGDFAGLSKKSAKKGGNFGKKTGKRNRTNRRVRKTKRRRA